MSPDRIDVRVYDISRHIRAKAEPDVRIGVGSRVVGVERKKTVESPVVPVATTI